MPVPNDPDALLRRDAVAAALTAAGFPTKKSTLAWLAWHGGGPVFMRYGKYPIYKWGDALGWAQSRLSRPVQSTSELAG